MRLSRKLFITGACLGAAFGLCFLAALTFFGVRILGNFTSPFDQVGGLLAEYPSPSNEYSFKLFRYGSGRKGRFYKGDLVALRLEWDGTEWDGFPEDVIWDKDFAILINYAVDVRRELHFYKLPDFEDVTFGGVVPEALKLKYGEGCERPTNLRGRGSPPQQIANPCS